jgi:serine/threonine protein phosphatase 1
MRTCWGSGATAFSILGADVYASDSQYKLNWPSRLGGRVLVVGDIHGENQMLQRLLKLAKFRDQHDFVFALGDLVDRGPNSCEVLDFFAHEYWRKSLMGNHEAMMLAAGTSWEEARIWERNGGDWARDLDPAVKYLYRCMIRQMPLTAEIDYDVGPRVGLVHAEVRPGLMWRHMTNLRARAGDASDDWSSTQASSAIWGRSRFVADSFLRDKDYATLPPDRKVSVWRNVQPIKGVDFLISGHSVTPDCLPRARGNILWIDTGAGFHRSGFKGRMTAVDPASRQYWQVGREESETWGPFPWPEFEPSPRRPTNKEFRDAKEREDIAHKDLKAALQIL